MSHKNSHSSTLFHFTKKQNYLLSVLRNGLQFSYCAEHIKESIVIGIPMVSICDISVMSYREHCSEYGLYAIGFSKKALTELSPGCEIGPVWYFTELQKALIDTIVFLITNNDKTIGWSKQFEMIRNGKVQIYYDECDLIILAFIDERNHSVKWLWNDKELRNEKKLAMIILEKALLFLSFISDVDISIINQEKNIPNFIKRMLGLETIYASIDVKLILSFRIISFEQLSSDC